MADPFQFELVSPEQLLMSEPVDQVVALGGIGVAGTMSSGERALREVLGQTDAVARLEKVSGQTDKATSAIRRVVTYSRERPAEQSLVDLGALVDQTLSLRQYQLGRLEVAALVDRGPNGDYRVRGDERQLTQALLNLVLNAEEALGTASGRQLQVKLTATPDRVRIAVSDNGTGVDPALRDRIFEPFISTSQSERALGLGLPVSRAIVESHGGKLWLSDETPGATFIVELPAGETRSC